MNMQAPPRITGGEAPDRRRPRTPKGRQVDPAAALDDASAH